MTDKGDSLMLTDHRIQINRYDGYIGIFLENIASVETKYKHYPVLLVLAVVAFIGSGTLLPRSAEGAQMAIGLGLPAILVAAWWFSRTHIVSICSQGGATLDFVVERVGKSQINEFIYKLWHAKQARTNQLHHV